MDQSIPIATRKTPWNKGKLVDQKAPLRLKDIGHLATRSWKARCVTSESKLTMRWRSPNRLKCSGSSDSVGWRHVRSPTGQ
jgi:hypothetical protein